MAVEVEGGEVALREHRLLSVYKMTPLSLSLAFLKCGNRTPTHIQLLMDTILGQENPS